MDGRACRSQRRQPTAASSTAPPAPCFGEALAEHRAGCIGDAELACIYIAGHVHARAGRRWLQAGRKPALPCTSHSPWLRLVAERELCQVPRAAAQALIGWAGAERPLELLFHVPSPRYVLALQARGRRCVSLLPPGADASPHADGLAFAIHDLCHAEKFMAPEHHRAQKGFFAAVDRAMADPRWQAMQAPFDPLWAADRDHVVSDMNGSAAFLFVAFKNKLKLAVRRRIARGRGVVCPGSGPMDREEAQAYAQVQDTLYDLLGLEGEALEAAWALSSKQSSQQAARTLVAWLGAAGQAEQSPLDRP